MVHRSQFAAAERQGCGLVRDRVRNKKVLRHVCRRTFCLHVPQGVFYDLLRETATQLALPVSSAAAFSAG